MEQILIADASPLMRRNLTMVLQREGYDLALSENGSDAFRRCLEHPPSLVVADAELPGMSGLKLCECLKDYPLTAHIPVLFLGTEDSPKALSSAFEAGGIEYLLKPIDSRHLIERVAYHLVPCPPSGTPVVLAPRDEASVSATVASFEGRRLRLWIDGELPLSFKRGFETEISYSDERDKSLTRRRAALDGPVEGEEGAYDFYLVGGVYRTQRRQFLRKAIFLPLRYRLGGDFYRVGFAADISGGGVRIQNVASSAKPGTEIQLELRLSGMEPPLAIDGEIVRAAPISEGGVEIGVAFQKIGAEDQSRLIMFLFGELLKDFV